MTSFNERLRAAMLSDAEAAENKRLRAAPATAPEFPADWAQMIHYPECWDTAAYPELRDAIHEALAWSGCSVCKPATAPERKPMHEGEIQAAWLGQDLDEPIPYSFVLGIRSAERFNGIKETP
jgi:predicted NAD/FAD-dependent oxidoreductase